MREKWICLLLTGALALSLAACAGGEAPAGTPSRPVETAAPTQPVGSAPPSVALSLPPEPTDPPAPEEPSLSAEPSAPPAVVDDLPDRDYQPWQTAYMDFLTALLQAEQDVREASVAYKDLAEDERGVCCLDTGGVMPMIEVMAMGSDSYCLYDVDGDGVLELFVKYGDCEAAFTTQCYTFQYGQVVCIGEFSSGHSGLFTCPGRSSVLRQEGHMGYAKLYEYPMEDGRLTEERVLFTEEDVRDYTPTDEIVPGAEYIESCYTRRGEDDTWSDWRGREPYSAGKALLLPISDYYDGPAATGDSTERAREAILAALNGEREVYGASGDHFDGDIGPAVWEEYVRVLTDVPNAETTAQITSHVWLDMNGDGQEECLLWLEAVTERGEETWSGEELVVLSVQDGTVFAYCCDSYGKEFYTDGTMLNAYGGTVRLSFWRDQCYEYAVRESAAAQPVKWLDGSPVE